MCRTLLDSGAARDPGMLYFDARLSVEHPTVEIRVCDVCAEPGEAVVIAALIRGLVETAAGDLADGAIRCRRGGPRRCGPRTGERPGSGWPAP